MNAQHRFKITCTAAAMAVLLPCAVARADTPSDASVTLKAESALDSTAGSRMSSVHVDTTDGRVTLFGKVATQRDKDDATAQVRPIAGVVGVRNLLQVTVPGIKDPVVRRPDAAVMADVRRALRADRSLDDSAITVESVHRGVVLLGGSAASSNDNVRALRSTADRPGVRRVFSDIDALAPLASAPAAQLAPLDAEDEIMRRDVTKALDDLDARGNADVRVMAKEGVVWLTGTVPSWDGNSSRLHAVRSVTGVRSIVNALRVAPIVATR